MTKANDENIITEQKPDEPKPVSADSKPLKKSNLFLRIFRWTFYGFIIFLILFAILLQTTFFKSWLLGIGVNYVNDNLVYPGTEIYAKELSGSLFKSVGLHDVGIIVEGDTLFKLNSLSLRFDLLKQRPGNIHVKNIKLDSPGFFMTKVPVEGDSLDWNVNRIFITEPDTVADTIPGEFDWKIKVDNFEISNAQFRILEFNETGFPLTLAPMSSLDSLNTGYLDVTNLDIMLNGFYSEYMQEAEIKNMSFKTNSAFNLNHFSLYSRLGSNSEINDLLLVTDRTNLKITKVYLEGMNVLDGFDYDEFIKSNIELKLLADKFNIKDLYFFLPSLDFMDNEVYLDLEARDNYSDLAISKLELKLRNTDISFAGRLKNLGDPENLFIDVAGNNIRIDPADTRYTLPGLDIPDFTSVGIVEAPFIKFTGEPLRFDTEYDIRTAAGNANGRTFIDLYGNEMVYRGDVQTTGLDIGRIINDEELNSNINGEFNFDGRGLDYATMNTKLTYSLSNTSFFKQEIKTSAGVVEFNSGDITLNVDYESNSVSAKVEGNINIRNTDAITYDLKGESRGLNIAGFTDDQSMTSDLNFDFEAKGTGVDPDNITGNFRFGFSPSVFGQFEIPAVNILADISTEAGEKNLLIESEVLDLRANGVFTFTSFTNIITNNIETLIAEMQSDRLNFDSIDIAYGDTVENFFSTEEKVSGIQEIVSADELNVNYDLRLKNLSLLKQYFDTTFVIVADIRGSIRNDLNKFEMTSQGKISDLKYGDSTLIVYNSEVNLQLLNDRENNSVTGALEFIGDSLIAGGMFVDTLSLLYSMGDENKFSVLTKFDTTTSVMMQGFSEFYKNRITLIIDTADFNFKQYNLYNQESLRLSYIPDTTNERIRFDNFKIRSADNQRIDLKGFYSLSDSSNIELVADNIRISGLQRLMNPRIDQRDEITGNVRRFLLNYSGTLENPNIYSELNTDPLVVTGRAFGRLDAIIDMKDGVIEPDISFYNSGNVGNMKITGEIPYQTEYTQNDSVGTRFIIEQNQPVNLIVDANNFQLDIFSRLIPNISNLRGTLDGKLNVTGTAEDPLLTGGLDLKNTEFRFDMTRMTYVLNAALQSEGQKLVITESKINVPGNDTRYMSASGYIDFTNLTLNDIDINFTGTVDLLQRKNGPTGFGIYGDLYGGSPSPGLKLKGNAEQLKLSGRLVLINGNVTMDPLGASDLYVYQLYDDDYVYSVKIDSASMTDSALTALSNFVSQLHNEPYLLINPFNRSFVPQDTLQVNGQAKASKFFYDIDLKSERNIYLNFIVNERAKNEFFGNVDVDMIIRNTQNEEMSAYGRVELGPNSKYRFYKNFDATGTVEFNGPVSNPVINIDAEYTTRSNYNDYTVEIKITGSLDKLDPPVFHVTQNGADIGGTDPSTAAMSIILFGSPQVSGSERNQVLSSIGANIGSLFVSDYVSSLVQDVLPFIVSTNINYQDSPSGNFAEGASLDVTAEFGDATVRVGGQIFSNINNTNITIEYPLNKLLNIQSLSNNLMLQVERVVNPYNTASGSISDETRTGALIYYRIKF